MPRKLSDADTNILVINGIKTALLANPTAAQQTIAQAGLNALTLPSASSETTNYTSYQRMMAAILENAEKKWKEDPNEVTEWCDTTNEAMKTKWKECWTGGSCPAAL